MHQSRCQYSDFTSDKLKLKNQSKRSQPRGWDLMWDLTPNNIQRWQGPRPELGMERCALPGLQLLLVSGAPFLCTHHSQIPLSYSSLHFRLVNPQLLEAFPDPTGAASPLADLWQLCLPLSRWIALHDSYLLSCLLHKNMKSSKREVPPDSSS